VSRLVAKEDGRFPFDFGQLYQGLFPDELGPTVLLDFTLAGKLFNRYLEHIGTKPRPESRIGRRVMVAVGGSFLAGSSGQQVIERYSLSRHDVLSPERIIRLADERRYPSVQADLARPRRLSTVLKHGASRKDWSSDDPWEEPEQALELEGQIMAGLLTEGFIEPEEIGVDDERLWELLGMANLGDSKIQRLLRLPAHRLEVLAQEHGWLITNPLLREYRLAQSIAELANRI